MWAFLTKCWMIVLHQSQASLTLSSADWVWERPPEPLTRATPLDSGTRGERETLLEKGYGARASPPVLCSASGSKRSKVDVAPSCMGRNFRTPQG